jgi:hypothetical protein
MNEKMKAYNEMSKLKFEVGDKLGELDSAKENYAEELMKEVIEDILKIQEENGKLTERDLKIFLRSLTLDIRNIYDR